MSETSKRGSAPEREEALRLARGWEAKPLPTEKITPEGIGVVARSLLALAADLEAAEQRFVAQERRYRATVEWGDKALMDACERERTRADDAERNLAIAREALERIRDWRNFRHTGEVRDAADAALRSLGEKA